MKIKNYFNRLGAISGAEEWHEHILLVQGNSVASDIKKKF
jgi:hypothetical protein